MMHAVIVFINLLILARMSSFCGGSFEHWRILNSHSSFSRLVIRDSPSLLQLTMSENKNQNDPHDSYMPVLAGRYNRGSALLKIFSERNKVGVG